MEEVKVNLKFEYGFRTELPKKEKYKEIETIINEIVGKVMESFNEKGYLHLKRSWYRLKEIK
jgi:CRISPR/Cas system-associated protein Cas10 (large subunit of type III CRISPR-Cas system)